MEKKTAKPLISICFTTTNDEMVLPNLLGSIEKQNYTNFEIVIADSGKGNCAVIAEDFGAKVIRMEDPEVERCVKRNEAIRNSRGDYILVPDPDMELDKYVLEDCVELMTRNSKLGGAIIPERSFGQGFWARCRALERECYLGDSSIESPRFFRREALERVGGYDEKLVSGEDWDLSQRMERSGYKIGRVKALIYHNEGKLSLASDLRKKFYYGSKELDYIRKEPLSIRLIMQETPFRMAYIRNYRKLLKKPHLAAGFLFMKFSELVFGGLGILVSLIRKI